MKMFFVCIILSFLLQCSELKAQQDSIEISRISDSYIEIRSLRYKLDTSIYVRPANPEPAKPGQPPRYADGIYIKRQFVPQPIEIANGTVLVMDRSRRPLDIYFYQDSVLIQHDEYYINGGIAVQTFDIKKEGLYIDKYFNHDGKLFAITYQRDGIEETFKYNDEGKMVECIK